MSSYKNDAAVITYSMYDAIESLPDDELRAMAYRTLISNGLCDKFDKTGNIMVDMILTLARPVQVSSAQKYQRARENGSKGGRPRKFDRATVWELQSRGYTQCQIARELKCHVNTVYNILHNDSTITDNNLEMESEAETEVEVVKGSKPEKDSEPQGNVEPPDMPF